MAFHSLSFSPIALPLQSASTCRKRFLYFHCSFRAFNTSALPLTLPSLVNVRHNAKDNQLTTDLYQACMQYVRQVCVFVSVGVFLFFLATLSHTPTHSRMFKGTIAFLGKLSFTIFHKWALTDKVLHLHSHSLSFSKWQCPS